MAAFIHFLKTIFIPLSLAALLYVLLALVLFPFIRRHRARYSQYLPLNTPTLASLSTDTSSFRSRLFSALYDFFVPKSWRRPRNVDGLDGEGDPDDSALFSDEEGEGMVGFDPLDERRREVARERMNGVWGERRLSRELEEGFRDDSDEEEEDDRRRSLSRTRTRGY